MFTSGPIPLSILRHDVGSLPIVFAGNTEPVATGFVKSMAHPGGNITCFTSFQYDMVGKWLELLKEIAPRLSRFAVMQNPQNPDWPGYNKAIQAMLRSSSPNVIADPVIDTNAIENAMSALSGMPYGGLIVLPDAFLLPRKEFLVELTAKHQVPTIYPFRPFPEAGGLVSYGPDLASEFRGAATYVDRILKGEKPSDLPVQAPDKFELVINLKTAKALGLTMPQTMLAAADEVIE